MTTKTTVRQIQPNDPVNIFRRGNYVISTLGIIVYVLNTTDNPNYITFSGHVVNDNPYTMRGTHSGDFKKSEYEQFYGTLLIEINE